jgi:phosphatidate cytidylyltransferase
MLKQRVITALVLLIMFGAALSVSTPIPFMALTLLMITLAGWEWSRLVGVQGGRAWASGVLCAALGLAGWQTLRFYLPDDMIVWLDMLWLEVTGIFPAPGIFIFDMLVWGTMGVLWIVGGAWLLRGGVARWSGLPRWFRWSTGMVMLIVAWLALAQALALGVNFLLSVLALTWAADIAAYFCGRALGGKLTGGRKLAPAISPGKSWEGAAGGLIGVLLTGAIWIWVDQAFQWSLVSPSLYTILWWSGPLRWSGSLWFVGGLALLTVMSVVGDLIESLVKRAAGAKDSSNLLPGHGGVLDRIDALLPTLPLALAMTMLARLLS